MYPPEHEKLADEVAASGYLLSESPPRMKPLSGAFPQRNRIISGLSVGTIVVEAADRSGALITARHAYEQGREVFAVPGPIDSRVSHGCHSLIKDGAKLVESIDDVLAELGPLAENIQRDDGTTISSPAELLLNEIEQQVLAAIDGSPTSVDAVAQVERPADSSGAFDDQCAGNAAAGAAGERDAGSAGVNAAQSMLSLQKPILTATTICPRQVVVLTSKAV